MNERDYYPFCVVLKTTGVKRGQIDTMIKNRIVNPSRMAGSNQWFFSESDMIRITAAHEAKKEMPHSRWRDLGSNI